MADAKLTALTAASALAGADLFYVSQSAASRKATGTQLLALVGTAYVPLAGDATMTGALTIASGTLTASAPALNITQTWNGAGDFDALSVDVTRTTSSAASFLANLKLAGTSKFTVRYDGNVVLTSGAAIYNQNGTGGAWNYNTAGESAASTRFAMPINSPDVMLYRDAAATLAQRNGTTQQIFRLYNTYTDSSNYERLTLTGVAGTSVNITAETLGTGGDNIDIVLTPAGTGSVYVPVGATATPGVRFAGTDVGFWYENFVLQCRGQNFGMVNFVVGNTTFKLAGTQIFGWASGDAYATAFDTAFSLNSSGVVEVNNGTPATYRDLKLRNLIQTEYQQMTEMTAPSAPATNSVRIYAEDNGSGKTRLMALFASGVAQQIAIEP